VCVVGEGKVLNEGVKVGKEGNETFHYSLSWSVMNGTGFVGGALKTRQVKPPSRGFLVKAATDLSSVYRIERRGVECQPLGISH
jgi:hypothetical protein